MINGPSDNDVQLKVIYNIKSNANNYNYRKQSTLINDVTINNFTTHLRNQNWESVYNSHGKSKSKAVPLQAMEAHGGRGGISPTHT
jgi:hypothetical protein